MKPTLACAVAILGAMAATAAAEPANELEIGSFTRGLGSPSAQAVTEENLGAVQFGYARRLPLPTPRDVSLWAVGRFSYGGATGTMFQSMETTVDYLELAAGVRARYRLHDNFRLGARIDLGFARSSLAITDAMRTYSDLKWGGVADVAGQLELLAVARPSFAFGVRLEVGYVMTTAVPLAPRAPGAAEGTLVLPVSQASLGHLDLGGSYFGLTWLGQF